jgi:hypothetical protein
VREVKAARNDGPVRQQENDAMTALRRLAPALVLVLANSLAACTGGEARDDGTALLNNKTGKDGLRVYQFDGAGRPLTDRALDPYFRFDTQDPEPKQQCLTDGDGSFEVRDSAGTVLVEHDFADRPVCEHDELDVTADLKSTRVFRSVDVDGDGIPRRAAGSDRR